MPAFAVEKTKPKQNSIKFRILMLLCGTMSPFYEIKGHIVFLVEPTVYLTFRSLFNFFLCTVRFFFTVLCCGM